jgi:hypothetical protein
MARQLLLSLAFTASLATAQETVVVGTTQYDNIKYYPTNCYNTETGTHTNEFWTYYNPSSTDNHSPDYKDITDPNGDLYWEGNDNVYVTDENEQFQVVLNKLAHSKDAGDLVGAIRLSNSPVPSENTITYPCYVTPSDQMEVDYGNGIVCYRLYTCSTVPHSVTSTVISSSKTKIEVTQQPCVNLMYGLTSQMNAAGGQIAQIPIYEQTFQDNEANSYSYVAEVVNNGLYNLFWTIQAATAPYQYINANPAAGAFDTVYAKGVLAGDASFPQSASIITYVGLDHTAYSKVDFDQTSFSPAPPSSACSNEAAGIGSGVLGAISAIIGTFAAAASPETGGWSLAVAAGVTGVEGGILGSVGAAMC